MSDPHQPRELLEKYKNNQCSPAEKALVEDWISYGKFPDYSLSNHELEQELRRMDKVLPIQKDTVRIWPRIVAAASILLVVSAGLFFYPRKQAQIAQNDIRPGGNKAILILSDGKRISLTDAGRGTIAKQSNMAIVKTASGQVVYQEQQRPNADNEIAYNTLETPKGGQYQVTLPDGTRVWLNAASSLQYPASFAALSQRKVRLSGEAYFEVAKDKAHPFIVETQRQNIEVLGTHFNVNSYGDEPEARTTLLEGAVLLNQHTVLKPGEQGSSDASGSTSVSAVNVDRAVAWKNGKFIFSGDDIGSIMRKLSRWYDIEVVYQGDISGRTFTGSISRYDQISRVLDKISYSQAVHFKIEGRRVTVMK